MKYFVYIICNHFISHLAGADQTIGSIDIIPAIHSIDHSRISWNKIMSDSLLFGSFQCSKAMS